MKNGIYKTRTVANESSSRPGKFYETVLWSDNSLSCNCPGWTKRVGKDGTRDCKHTRDLYREVKRELLQPWTVKARVQDVKTMKVTFTEPPEGRRRIFWED